MRTKADVADERLPEELHRQYDTALPQDWVDVMMNDFGYDPRPHIVWLYDGDFKIFGRPYPITTQGVNMITVYNQHCETEYPAEFLQEIKEPE